MLFSWLLVLQAVIGVPWLVDAHDSLYLYGHMLFSPVVVSLLFSRYQSNSDVLLT